jgi:Nucleotidyltransferase of unknown function (DUF6036)
MVRQAAPMIELFQSAKNIQEFCDQHGWRSCVIGGIAVIRWGRPRVTRDVDLNVLTGFGGEDEVIETLLANYRSRLPDAREFARAKRVLLLCSSDGTGIDVSLGALPFEEKVIERASFFAFAPGLELRTCSAEDLIVMKLFASRPGDIRDVEGVAIRNRSHLDWGYIEEQLHPLADLKDEPEILRAMERLREL